MLDCNRLSLENIVDLTLYAQGFPFGAESSLIPFFSHLPNVEALRIFEYPPHWWGSHPIVSDTLLLKLKKFSGRPEHSGLVLSDERRPIEWLEIEGGYNLEIETIPGHLEWRTVFLSKVLWEEDCVKKLGARFPKLESVTLYADEDDTNYVVHTWDNGPKTWVNGPNVVNDMASLPHLKKIRLVVNSSKHHSGEAASVADYPPVRINEERSILKAVKASSCPDIEEARLSEGCHWWFDREDGWKHELVYENHTAFELKHFFRVD